MAKKVKKKRNILNLYPEDFEKSHIWKDVCDVLGISSDNTGVEIEFTNLNLLNNGKKSNNNN
jgi:hypothetical protein